MRYYIAFQSGRYFGIQHFNLNEKDEVAFHKNEFGFHCFTPNITQLIPTSYTDGSSDYSSSSRFR
jgi:hypothetical protein